MPDVSNHPSVAILGAGAIGEILIQGLLEAGWSPDEISPVVRRPDRAKALTESSGCRTSLDPVEAITGQKVVVIATKPHDVPKLLDVVAPAITTGQVVVSVAAGVPIRTFEERMDGVAVVRAMPNTPARVGEGVTGIAPGTHANDEAIAAARAILEAVGIVYVLDEAQMDAVTAVSGTGPAYVFLLAEALAEAAIREGIPRDLAEAFVHQTIRGAGHLLTETEIRPSELREQVTSPGGTTAAAVHVLEERGFRALVEDAVRAAAERARELGADRT